ncbi:two-component response regulator-like PRR37 isoform X2 [Juglans microcarpa x Juglans regia]|uniref:two-component response regulator-like PRR37 isoform X2 n=1 Tax=Juglans microcarpa x Juglans regia TaxID=2249226 RepID=UPI001B7EB13A|nr:two-component response regulator-like PRR37 isoform X2 [Juglans microcarpa x Juglans regia]
MGAVPANNDDVRGRGLVEQNSHISCDQKQVTNGVVGEGQGLQSLEEDELRINEVTQEVSNGPRALIQAHDGSQILQQQPQGPIICWERFLPIRSLKVLLVENDDSTRQVVSALLRNCSYEVIAVANGIQAWKILEDPTNHIDLILTEVVMPVLSGIGLLCKIMSHRSLKNIPVIMMSSHDSMGIVFKCLSKGAVDFLAKPIRKNELKNLWQHVWRRCHSSSGSGSESGTQTRKSGKSESDDGSDNDTGSCDEHDNGSNGLSRDGSDNGSGTQENTHSYCYQYFFVKEDSKRHLSYFGTLGQSSWTKRAAEVESPQPISPPDQITDGPDSTCAQVIHTKPEKFSNRWVHVTETKECPEQDEQHGVCKDPDSRHEFQHEMLSIHLSSRSQNVLANVDSKPFDSDKSKHNSENAISKPENPSSNMAKVVNSTYLEAESRDFDTSNGLSDISQTKAHCDSRQLPSLVLTLKRMREDFENVAHDDRNVLRHSDLSAFSKYNTASSVNKAHTGNVGSCSPLDDNSAAQNTGTTHNFQSHSSGNLPNQHSNGSSSNNDVASTDKCVIPKLEVYDEKPESISAFKSFHSSTFESVQNTPGKATNVEVNKVQAQTRGSKQQVQVQHHHHHHHHYHHHVHNLQQHQLQQDCSDVSRKNMAGASQQCGSSNVVGGPVESNAGDYSVNGSASGSNYGSNGQNGSCTALNAGVTNVESENGAAGNVGAGAISGKNSGNGSDEERVAHREAALNKFRQKRKERCFEKRVRYQSRKKLAEQRPRIRGQFVKQTSSDNKAGQDCQSKDHVSGDISSDSLQ